MQCEGIFVYISFCAACGAPFWLSKVSGGAAAALREIPMLHEAPVQLACACNATSRDYYAERCIHAHAQTNSEGTEGRADSQDLGRESQASIAGASARMPDREVPADLPPSLVAAKDPRTSGNAGGEVDVWPAASLDTADHR